ncbi:hypothetical protein QQG74_21620 [Micromonospora sp. FIMYZ51]|uniref:hypothetical protein n=1 Tax=Micromonospora sp. FIMYZ51 TaxID=3051832 RepID=UPI00311D88FD
MDDSGALGEYMSSVLSEKARAHLTLRESDPFQGQVRRLDRLTSGLLSLIWQSWAQSSRHRPIVDNFLMYAGTDYAIESLVSIQALVPHGSQNVARRECRFMLEQAVKHLYVDQQLPSASEHDRSARLSYLRNQVDRSSIEPIWSTSVYLPADRLQEFRRDAKNAWSQMAKFIHPSVDQIQIIIQRTRRDAPIGFEAVSDLTKLVDELARIYDILGVLWLTACGPSAAGDILVGEDVDGWPFVRTKWLPEMSTTFDYKHERKEFPRASR